MATINYVRNLGGGSVVAALGTAARPRLRPRVLWSGSVDQATRLPETVIAFAGAKWVFLVQFSGAEVMPVSMVAI